jgi:hypothetical protein
VAINLTIATTPHLEQYHWVVKWVWLLCGAAWVYWITTHETVRRRILRLVGLPIGEIPDIEDNPDMNALNLWITNNFADVTLERSELFLRDRRLIGGQQPEPLAVFTPMTLTKNADGLPPKVKRRFQLVEFKNPASPIFQGYVNGSLARIPVPMMGTWQLDLEIRWANGNGYPFQKCFRWDASGAPRFVKCPRN